MEVGHETTAARKSLQLQMVRCVDSVVALSRRLLSRHPCVVHE